MAQTPKVLWQNAPAGTTLTKVYTVPGLTNTLVSSIAICNRSPTPTNFRLSLRVAGAADDNKQYLYYDQAIDSNETFIATIGVTLGAADEVWFLQTAATLACQGFGVEQT